jgi:hypothetical protein
MPGERYPQRITVETTKLAKKPEFVWITVTFDVSQKGLYRRVRNILYPLPLVIWQRRRNQAFDFLWAVNFAHTLLTTLI